MINLKKIYSNNNLKKITLVTGGGRGIGKKISITVAMASYITIVTTTKKEYVKRFNFYLKYKSIHNIIILTLNLKYKNKINKFIKNIKKKNWYIINNNK